MGRLCFPTWSKSHSWMLRHFALLMLGVLANASLAMILRISHWLAWLDSLLIPVYPISHSTAVFIQRWCLSSLYNNYKRPYRSHSSSWDWPVLFLVWPHCNTNPPFEQPWYPLSNKLPVHQLVFQRLFLKMLI